MEIPSIIFIVVGIIIAFVTSRIQEMQFFYFVGAGFILWGILKIAKKALTKRIFGSETKAKEVKPNNYYKDTSKTQDTTACPNCSLKHYSTANYCQQCGAKLK